MCRLRDKDIQDSWRLCLTDLKDQLRELFLSHGLQVEEIDVKPVGWWSKDTEWEIKVKHAKVPMVKRAVTLHFVP